MEVNFRFLYLKPAHIGRTYSRILQLIVWILEVPNVHCCPVMHLIQVQIMIFSVSKRDFYGNVGQTGHPTAFLYVVFLESFRKLMPDLFHR